MVQPKYTEGDEFHLGADGHVEIVGLYRTNDETGKVVYEVKYLDQPGEPVSPLSETELEEVN